MYFIGLDIGTSNIKALLTDESGAALKTSIRPNIPRGGEYDPKQLWLTVIYVLRECVAAAGGAVKAISISSMTEAGLPLDGKQNALYGIIPWSDKRTLATLPVIRKQFSDYELYKRTGQHLQAKYPLTRLVWLKEHEPDIFYKTRKWLSVGDYILYKLTGELVTDYTQACRTMLYNIKNNCWDEELTDYCGVAGMLPKVEKMGYTVGYVRDSVLKELGNTRQIELKLGGHDHLVALAACELEVGEVFNSVGTSEVFAGLTHSFNADREVFESGISQGLTDQGLYYWMAGVPSSGASLEWFMRLTGLGYAGILEISDRYLKTDITYLPYINGSGAPRTDSSVKGSLIGLSFSDGKEHVLKAIYEGISFQCAWILDTLKKLNLSSGEKLRVCGGGAKNPVWQQIKADILKRGLGICAIHDMSAYGAALQALGICENKQALTLTVPDNTLDAYYESKNSYFKTVLLCNQQFIGIVNEPVKVNEFRYGMESDPYIC